MKRKPPIIITVMLSICLLFGCSGIDESENSAVDSSVKVTTLIADDFREKTAAAEKWAAENVDIAENDSYKRHESDVLTVGDATYLCVSSWETNGMGEVVSYQLEKYVNGERTVLADVGGLDFGGDFPISIVKDGENALLIVMGDALIMTTTWNNAGKIIVAYGDGETEIIDYSFTDSLITDEMLGGREYRGFRCDFVHLLKSGDVASLMFVSAPDKYSGVTTRLFELDESLTPISASVVNGDGAFEEDYSAKNPVSHVFPELFE